MRSIFLDVGGHIGQTLEEVLKPLYHFDLIYCFEPSPKHAQYIRQRFRSPRLRLMQFGLSNVTGPLDLHDSGPNGIGASVKQRQVAALTSTTRCDFVSASEFFRDHIRAGDLVIMKLNCEGSECDILNDLIESGEISKIGNVMIDFDVRKFPHLVDEEKALLARMHRVGFKNFMLCEKVMRGKTHQKRIENWLRAVPFHEKFRPKVTLGERIRGLFRH
jgi:FkbM family methyltransferase